ncbi:hypothetical protein FRC12_001300 [Ceratobasidium sp. 428]|nr:hypothetical protein FRC12_001300 [Ceratobasidium sp. 428]
MPAVCLKERRCNIKDYNSVARQGANAPDVNPAELHSPANTTERRKLVNYADCAGYTTYSPDASATHAHTVAMPSVSQFGSHTHTARANSMPGSRRSSGNHRDLQSMAVQGHYMHGAHILERCIDHASNLQRIPLVAETALGASTLVRDHGNHQLRSLTDIHATSALTPSLLYHRRAFNEGETSFPVAPASAPVGPVYYEPSEAVPQPGVQTSHFSHYPTSTSYPTQALSAARQGYLQTSPTIATCLLRSPACWDNPSAEEQLAYATFPKYRHQFLGLLAARQGQQQQQQMRAPSQPPACPQQYNPGAGFQPGYLAGSTTNTFAPQNNGSGANFPAAPGQNQQQ